MAPLVADPADGGAAEAAEDHQLGIDIVDGLCDAGAVKFVVLRAAGIKPEIIDVAVIEQQLPHLTDDEIVILFGHIGGVELGAGIVKTDLDAVAAAGIHIFAHNVTFTVLPGGGLDGMVGVGRGPEGKAVVVLGGQDGVFCAGGLGCTDPLVAVKLGGVEGIGGHGEHIPVAVFLIEGADAEMEEHSDLILQKLELTGGGL